VTAVGWLSERAVVGIGWSVVVVAVGWRLVVSRMVWTLGVMGEKYVWIVVWDRRRRGLEGQAGRASALGLVKRCVTYAQECCGGLGLARCPSAVPSIPVQVEGPGSVAPEGQWGLHRWYGADKCAKT
jgi:hypothetical protein